ncbi:hypothetical protein MIND_00036800 [Mycena indigotica]|uniref:Domain of unknown function at the cortex 1 domain-containing protein n=1 Tax=Mycena indigotica TaxID=2126181 RepID=A0A8H6WE10_9AGAR|nr:uncharacterized protein MIND_00036800 [Mycena indigotica]KAF7315224.1 hypothetical protein MIND_00036800 [Mycena indigotica]
MPTLRVLAGPSPQQLSPITELVNSNIPFAIRSAQFDGSVVVFIKGLNQVDPTSQTCAENEYFGRQERSGVTWSIQVQGRFLTPRSSNDILFGNIFERPLKLPWGTGAALKFMKLIDPTLSHDLTCTATSKPWALSPLVSTMPYLKHTRVDANNAPPKFPSPASITDDTDSLYLCAASDFPTSRAGTPSSMGSSSSQSSGSSSRSQKSVKKAKSRDVPRAMSSQQRRSFFSSESHRQAVVFGPNDVITTDFCYGFLEFAPALRLRLPGGLGFDLARYWDGQPVRFVCCERKCEDDGSDDPWGRPLWCVSIELDSEDGLDCTA